MDDIESREIQMLHEEMVRLNKLTERLLDTLHATIVWIMHYHEQTGVPIPKIDALRYLMKEVTKLMTELGASDESLQGKRPDDKVPEPSRVSSNLAES